MFNINDMASLRAAYSFVRTLRDVTVPVENVARRDKHIADVKREIREFTHRAASRSHIVRDDGIDGYVELVQLPEALDEAHKVVAADWFRANRYLEFLPTPYDCSATPAPAEPSIWPTSSFCSRAWRSCRAGNSWTAASSITNW